MSALKPREVVQALLRAGFYIHHHTGGHAQLRHPKKDHLRVTIPQHTRFDLPSFVVASIIKQAELSREEFLGLF